MQARTWLFITLGTILLVTAAVLSLNAGMDIYGLFRNPQGRKLVVYGDERISKYLLCDRYVPANFNAILAGSSVTANWNTGRMDALRVYNASLNGGNIVEERCLLESALTRPGIQVALMVVHPFLTRSHDFETVRLTPREKAAALGSLSLWEAYKDKIKFDLLRKRRVVDEFGTNDFPPPLKGLNPILEKMMRPGESFEIDPIAMETYREAVATLHARNIPIMFIAPPLYEGLLEPKRDAFAGYLRIFQAQMTARDTLIDLNADEYAGFRRNRQNFSDGVHVTRDGAEQVVSIVNDGIKAWLRQTGVVAR